jgi:transmembrane sensor
MEKEKFLKLLSRHLSKDISVADQYLFEKATEDHEEYKLLAAKLQRYFGNQDTNLQKNQLSQTWEKIKAAEIQGFESNFDYRAPEKTRLHRQYLLRAAILLLLIGAGIFGYHQYKYNPDFSVAMATDQKVFKVLDDGTKVWLNKKSSVSYNKAFGQGKREIFLEGEAYFDVVKNQSVPLFIHAGNIDIEVKGTAFNVNAYKENPEIKVSLVRGSIQVTDKLNNKDQVLLRPNQKLIFSTSPQKGNQKFLIMSMAPNSLLQELRWTSDTLTFQKEKLKELALRMEKKYDLKIVIQSEQLKEKRFSGAFINETIQQALEALKLSYPLTYTINNRMVVIKG